MKKIKNIMNEYIKNISGHVIGIGLSDELTDKIEQNDKILTCDLLDYNSKAKGEGKGKTKRLYFKDIRKKYKKKRIDYIIGNIETIEVCKKTFIIDSIYINKKKIIYYVQDESKLELYLNRYKRYNVDIEVIECSDGKIIEIDTTNSKNYRFKDKVYYIKDSLYDLGDIIGDILSM